MFVNLNYANKYLHNSVKGVYNLSYKIRQPMKSTTRQQILEYIQSKEVACAAEISRALHMTAANARHHLSALKDEGVVTVIGQRPSPGRGRPVDLYRLTLPLVRHNLDGLANVLLLELLDRADSER
jgi:predicted ArsR family transcriptional regulator